MRTHLLSPHCFTNHHSPFTIMTFPVSILAFQSITPAKVTPPGKSRQISVAGNLLPASLAAHFRLILYYRPDAGEDNSAQAVGARIRETLSVALSAEPLLAGRLRRSKAENGGWEVRFNDAGVRLVLAAAAAEMSEVLDAGDREDREWGLVFWRDVEMENPDQSALFYTQIFVIRKTIHSAPYTKNYPFGRLDIRHSSTKDSSSRRLDILKYSAKDSSSVRLGIRQSSTKDSSSGKLGILQSSTKDSSSGRLDIRQPYSKNSPSGRLGIHQFSTKDSSPKKPTIHFIHL